MLIYVLGADRVPENPTRQEFLTPGKTRPDPKPETKPAGTRIWKKATISTTTSDKIRVKIKNT